ncbi:unnamed protein product, partial [Mesorhabditis spiculigera]
MVPAAMKLLSLIAFGVARVIGSKQGQIGQCLDKSPYCNANDCSVRPGYALQFCRKTCGDCGDFCENSVYVSCKEERKAECQEMLKVSAYLQRK